MKIIVQLTLVLVLAFGWLPAAAQGEAPVDVPEPSLVVDSAAVDYSEPYLHTLANQVFLPAVGTDHDGANAVAAQVIAAGTVTAADAFTTDTRYNERNYFYTGQVIKYIGIVGNTTGAARTATLQWRLNGPCSAGILWSGAKTVAAGANQWWVLDRVIPTCPGDYVFTFKVTYGGVTTSLTSNFSVIALDGGIQLFIKTVDQNNKSETSFKRGTPIGYTGIFFNAEQEPAKVEIRYWLRTKCEPHEYVLTSFDYVLPPGRTTLTTWRRASSCRGPATFLADVKFHDIYSKAESGLLFW